MFPRVPLAVLLAVSVVLMGATVAGPSPAHAAEAFDDVADDAPYVEAVEELVRIGILAGCDEGEFCPDDILTRGQAASLLSGARDLREVDLEEVAATAGLPFTDIEDSVHAANIVALAEAEITSGCTEDRFCPSDVLTRQQFASLLVQSFPIPDTDQRGFDDVSGIHRPSIDRLAAAGITSGCGRSLTDFCPREPVERWEAALLLARTLDLVERVELEPLDERRERQEEIDREREREREETIEGVPSERIPIWDALADCESGDRIDGQPVEGTARWHTGATDPELDERASWSSGRYDGGLQFHPGTWDRYRDADMPANAGDAPREQEMVVAERVLAAEGWGAWPTCSRMLGLR